MAFNADQRRRLSLGGTQALPAPGREIAKIQWACKKEKKTADSLVRITHEKAPNHANVWFVRLRDLMAIEAKKKPNAKPKKVKWRVGRKAIKKALSGTKRVRGVAYVREDAQTLLQMEHGVSVIDSSGIVVSGSPLPARETDAEFRIQCPC